MKNLLTIILIFVIFFAFKTYIEITTKSYTVLEVKNPTTFGIDINKNKKVDKNEYFCIDGIESFSINPTDEFVEKYSKLLGLNNKEMISLGFLAQDQIQKVIINKKVSIVPSEKITSGCKYAQIYYKNTNYETILKNTGFGIVNNKIFEKKKFEQNLKNARKLNLVILNHRSNKYHTLDCPYGKLARNAIILPQKQLPQDAKPCKYCHKIIEKLKHNKKAFYNISYMIPNLKQPPLTLTQGNISLFYTDFTRKLRPDNSCNTQVCKQFVKQVNNAKSSIDIAIYGYDNNPTITSALQNAKNRGVNIRFIFDEQANNQKSFYQNNDVIKNLATVSRSDCTESKTQSNYIMHNKFVIFDKEIVYTGSMNFSNSGLSGYDVNDVVIINSSEIANLYTKEFEQMLNGNFHKKKSKHNISNRFLMGDTIVEVYFSPQDKSSQRIIDLIRNSKKYVYLPTFLITHSKIAEELINAHNRKVDVKLILDANSVNSRNTKHAILRNSGIPVKIENYAGKLHSKTIIIDDTYLIIGSMNFSNSGENKNDENLLVIKNPKFAQSHKIFFNYLWQMIPNKYLKFNPKPESPDSIGSCFDGVDNNFNGKIDKDEPFCHPKPTTKK